MLPSGTEILVIPDAAAMGKAKELHVFKCRLTKQDKNSRRDYSMILQA
jgi:hypothetical protein